jgi:AraC-like DNA-binding protein
MQMNHPEILQRRSAPEPLRAWMKDFVYRDDASGGEVVYEFPELRPSIQIMLGDPYWLRERAHASPWMRAPRIGIWGPRYEWGYGFAKRRITVFAFGLTPKGLTALTGASVRALANQVAPLNAFNARLADLLNPAAHETFERWCARAGEGLRAVFCEKTGVQSNDWLDDAIRTLATNAGSAVRLAADRAGLSERHFRRLFQSELGLSPKRYQQLLRVDRMLRQLHPNPWEMDTFADDASIPFADQPHAIREFRRITAMTPSAYVRSKRNLGGRVLRSAPAPGIAPPVLRSNA